MCVEPTSHDRSRNHFNYFAALVTWVFAATFFAPTTSQAEVLLEPSAGLSVIGATGTYKNTKINTSALGLDAGFILAKTERDWYAGLVSHFSFLSYDSTIPAEMGYSIGFGIGGTLVYIPLRFYGSIDFAGGGDGLIGKMGVGLRLGVTYYFTPQLALNIESKSGKAEETAAVTSVNLSVFNISLSIPMELAYPNTPWRERVNY